MAIEENIAGEKGKENELAEESTSPPQAVSSASVPSATTPPPPVSEKDAAKAPPSPPQPPPRPPQKVQTPLLQPLPPPHPHATAHRGSRHPEVFPVGYYDPSDATLPNGPEQVVFSKGWRITKLVMSTASLVCSVVVVGLGIAIASWGGKFSIQEALFGITTATAGLAILWTAIDSLVTCLSNERHRVHPGAHVALHLIIWLLAVLSVVSLALDGQRVYYYNWAYYYSYYSDIRRIESALLGFMVLLMLIHFFLFVRACVETHKVNTASRRFKNTIVRYVNVPVQADGSGGMIFPGVAPGVLPQPYPNPSNMTPAQAFYPPGTMAYAQPQGKGDGGLAPPPQAVLYSGYYAPAPGTHIDPSIYGQHSAAAALHGYYGPPPSAAPKRQSSGSSARYPQRAPSAASSSGSGSRRTSRQNPEAPRAPPAESS